MFTQSCFIRKNTLELRKKLEELRYKSFGSVKYGWDTGWGLSTDNRLGEFESFDNNGLENIIKYEDSIDCGDNEELFLALASLRDDTDRHQWFVDDNTGIWERSENELPSRYMQMEGHKATVEEIIKHFT